MQVELCVSTVAIDMMEKKVLLVFEHQDGKDVINLPSGHVEVSEDPEQGASREFYEETSLYSGELYFAGTTLLEAKKNYFTMVYACHGIATSEPIEISGDGDVYQAKWLSAQEVNELRHLHRNDLIDRKIRMAIACLEKVTEGKYHKPWGCNFSN